MAGDKALEKLPAVAKAEKEKMVNRMRTVGVTFGRVLAMVVELDQVKGFYFLMISE